MSVEPGPTLVEPILEPTILRKPDMVEADAVPILDENGNETLDEDGRVIYGVR
jgi:hypothetical protein